MSYVSKALNVQFVKSDKFTYSLEKLCNFIYLFF